MNYQMSADMKRFNRLVGQTNQVYHTIAQTLGLSDSAFEVLYTLCILGDGCPLSQVVQQTFLPKQTVNSALRKLEKDGLLTLQSIGTRKKTLHLTEAGESLRQEKLLPLQALEDQIFGSWTQEERDIYLRLTQRYLDDIRTLSQEKLGGSHD